MCFSTLTFDKNLESFSGRQSAMQVLPQKPLKVPLCGGSRRFRRTDEASSQCIPPSTWYRDNQSARCDCLLSSTLSSFPPKRPPFFGFRQSKIPFSKKDRSVLSLFYAGPFPIIQHSCSTVHDFRISYRYNQVGRCCFNLIQERYPVHDGWRLHRSIPSKSSAERAHFIKGDYARWCSPRMIHFIYQHLKMMSPK